MTQTRQMTATVVTDAHGTRYKPWTDGWAIGYQITCHDGAQRYLYLNPSGEDSEGQPNVFVYEGTAGDPADDDPIIFVSIGQPQLMKEDTHDQ